MTAADAQRLRGKLLEVAGSEEAQLGELDIYGQRYTIAFELETEAGMPTVRSGWIILHEEAVPRLTTCYIKRRKR